jgi:hypothetical protein
MRLQAVSERFSMSLLPAEHAAGMSDGRYAPNSGHPVAAQYRSLRAMNRLPHRNMTTKEKTASRGGLSEIRSNVLARRLR